MAQKKDDKPKRHVKAITLPGGKRKYIYAHSSDELDAKVLQARLLMSQGVKLDDKTTFGEYALMWYKTYKEPNLRYRSRRNILQALDAHILPQITALPLRDILPIHIQKIMASLEGKSQSVQNKILQTLKSIFRTAVDNNLIIKTPVTSEIKAHGKHTEEKIPLTKAESKALLDRLCGTRPYLFVLTALMSGMRRGELIGMMWDQVDLLAKTITVSRNSYFGPKSKCVVSHELKTAAAHRVIPIPTALASALTSAKANAKSLYVFPQRDGGPMGKSSFLAMWRIVDRTGIKCTPHLLRHTYITRLFEAGLDIKEVQYLAGHSTPEMTLRVYTHYQRSVRQQSTAEKINAGFSD